MAETTPDLTLPCTLRSSRVKMAMMFLGSLLSVAGGIIMIREGQWLGYIPAAFFGLGAVVCAVQLHPGASYLHLTPDGFTYSSLFRAHTVRWEHVREFGVTQVGLTQMVGWNHAEAFAGTRAVSALSKRLSNYEAALPDTYGLKPQELADMMESLRQAEMAEDKA